MENIDLDDFEEQFKMVAMEPRNSMSVRASMRGQDSPFQSDSAAEGKTITLLDPSRKRNLEIIMRKLDLDVDKVVELINRYDTTILVQGYTELLTRLMLKPDELQAYREYDQRQGQSKPELDDVDQKLLHLSRVPRLEQKVAIMAYMNSMKTMAKMDSPVKGDELGSSCPVLGNEETTLVKRCAARLQTIKEASHLLQHSKGKWKKGWEMRG